MNALLAEGKSLLMVGARLPKRSETFVYRDVFGLRGEGIPVVAASVHPPERGLGDEALERLAEEAIGIYGPGIWFLVRDAAFATSLGFRRSLSNLRRVFGEWFEDGAWRKANGWRVWVQIVAGFALAHRVRGLKIGHVHAHLAHVPATIGLVAARQLGVSFSFTGHAADLFRDGRLLVAKLKAAAFVACISEWHRHLYRSLVWRKDSAYPVIRCGVEVPAAISLVPPSQTLTVMTVARLVPKKGIDVLLRALALLLTDGVSVRGRIVGDGPERLVLEELCCVLGISSQVEWMGELPHREVQRWFGSATIFVLPCRIDREGDRDGIPVVLMEAMAAGLPCVSSDLPAIRELISDGKSGDLVPVGEALVLKYKLMRLLTDALLRRRYAEAGRRRVEEEFSSKVNVPRFSRVLRGGERG